MFVSNISSFKYLYDKSHLLLWSCYSYSTLPLEMLNFELATGDKHQIFVDYRLLNNMSQNIAFLDYFGHLTIT